MGADASENCRNVSNCIPLNHLKGSQSQNPLRKEEDLAAAIIHRIAISVY